ncbi:heme/hemin ABC transporter substrate-binding protein [Chenggangzhangella methanolivorans]|uniref:ABC transporter substrate-binding protein n=1 Tax=Chenggangzhangella methanolivorans TaxID=1437009 RepID=A0A9E6R5Q3_9HYPH|nr:ABC transporter substrate-binding protein [Chenggangzhangella methanolivorans]QZN98672.1 ABC transporter substrate-binding protein [Chenggangzhangella methanolivorans]
MSLGGAATEILYALGAGDRIAAVDVSSRFPSAARAKPNVGYYRSLSAEGVLALGPDLVVATDGAGPKEAIDVLKGASVGLLQLDEATSGADVAARMRRVAGAVGEAARGEAAARRIEEDAAALEASLSKVARRRRAIVLLGPPRGGALMAAGAGSSGAHALALSGADNAAAALSGWKPLTDEAAYAMEPDAIVVLATSAPVSPDEIARHPAFAGSPAVKENRVVSADALGFIGFGPRVAHAARAVAAGIYPEAAIPDLPERDWTVDRDVAAR